MDLGLGHLSELKQHLLAASLRSSTDYDVALAALGKGVAASFERVCARKFGRAVGATYECAGNVEHFIVDRYPIESIASISLRESLSEGWVDQGTVNTIVENIAAAAGLVTLGSRLSTLASSRLRTTYTGGFWYPTAPAIVLQSGSVTIASGAMAASVSFGTAFEDVPTVLASTLTPADGAILAATPLQVTKDGFVVRLSAAAPASGYSVQWVAVYGGTDADAAILQQGSLSLEVGDGNRDITFGTAFAAAPVVVCEVLTPDGGYLIGCAPSQITTAGFKALLGFEIPETGYKVQWIAISPTATAAAATLPSGATALPDDLKHAWLRQCQLVWNSSDSLGNGITGGAVRQNVVETLAKVALAPDVQQVLNTYRRIQL